MCVRMVPGFVRDPLLINIFVKTRQDSHHLTPASAHHDVTAHRIKNVNGFSLPAGHQREYMIVKSFHPKNVH